MPGNADQHVLLDGDSDRPAVKWQWIDELKGELSNIQQMLGQVHDRYTCAKSTDEDEQQTSGTLQIPKISIRNKPKKSSAGFKGKLLKNKPNNSVVVNRGYKGHDIHKKDHVSSEKNPTVCRITPEFWPGQGFQKENDYLGASPEGPQLSDELAAEMSRRYNAGHEQDLTTSDKEVQLGKPTESTKATERVGYNGVKHKDSLRGAKKSANSAGFPQRTHIHVHALSISDDTKLKAIYPKTGYPSPRPLEMGIKTRYPPALSRAELYDLNADDLGGLSVKQSVLLERPSPVHLHADITARSCKSYRAGASDVTTNMDDIYVPGNTCLMTSKEHLMNQYLLNSPPKSAKEIPMASSADVCNVNPYIRTASRKDLTLNFGQYDVKPDSCHLIPPHNTPVLPYLTSPQPTLKARSNACPARYAFSRGCVAYPEGTSRHRCSDVTLLHMDPTAAYFSFSEKMQLHTE